MPEGVDVSGIPQLPVVNLSQDQEIVPTLQEPNNPELRENEGLRMDFRIDNKHLISHSLASMDESRFSSQEHKEDILALQNSAWKESEQCYNFIVGRLTPAQFFASGGTLEEVTGFLTRIEQTSEFGKVRQQTEVYLASIKAEWERNYAQTAQAVQEMVGVDLNKQVTVNVTHPSLKNGQYLGNNVIAWGHTPEWDNYATVYLWHEVLHSYLGYTDLSHALIQLVTDNELRVRLNEGESYPPFVGHKDLFPLMDKILPYWRTYLSEIPVEGRRDLEGFEKKLQTMSEFQNESQGQTPATPVIE